MSPTNSAGQSMNCSVFIASSLDGFIARTDGSIDWLPTGGTGDYGYSDFMAAVDCVIMGRATFEKVLSFGDWPFAQKPVVVLSKTGTAIPARLASTVRRLSAPPRDVVQTLTREGLNSFYIDGGRTIQGFLAAGLITRLIVTRVPILLGAGLPLFGHLTHDQKLLHIKTTPFADGLVQSEYAVPG